MKETYDEVQLVSKDLQLKLEKGEIEYSDDVVQFFLPSIFNLTEFEWLDIVAKNTLIEEDYKIVSNYLSMVKILTDINAQILEQSVMEKLLNLFNGEI